MWVLRHCCLVVSLVLALLKPAFGREPPATPPDGAVSTSPALPTSSIEFKDGQISVKAHDSSIGLLANELSHKAGIAVVVTEDVGSQRVSVEFEKRSLDEGVRQVFAKQDCFLFYGVDGDQPSSLKAGWVYPKA